MKLRAGFAWTGRAAKRGGKEWMAERDGGERRAPTFTAFGATVAAAPVAPGLHVVSTPIGNLGDITIRALGTLAAADAILAEDTRHTRILLDHYGIATPLQPYHEHNAAAVRPGIMARLAAGAALALVSDAGTPLVSDPGYKLVVDVAAAGLPLTAAPGASAVLGALVLAGLPTDRFFFEGFLPTKTGARRTRLAELAVIEATIVIFEAARRLPEALADMAAVLGNRPAAVARELTKRFETVSRGSLATLAAEFGDAGVPRGEVVVVIGPPDATAPTATPADIDAKLARALETLSVKDAAAVVAGETGLPRRDIYGRAVALAAQRRTGG